MRKSAAFAGTLLIGFGTGWFAHDLSHDPMDPRYHWTKVRGWLEIVNNPQNQEQFSQGIASVEPPYEILPHLEVLVANGELRRAEVVIPGLPPEEPYVRRWLKATKDPDIVYGVRPATYDQDGVPFMFTLWYKPQAEERVQSLIREFKLLGQEHSK